MTTALHGRTNKRWRLVPHDAERISRLEQAAGVSPIVAQLLLGRGVYEAEAARIFLDAKLTGLRDPEQLPGAAEAADRMYAAVRARRKIVVYGDYDADGMTATAILLSCLKLLGADVSYYVPNRLEEGYGLSCDALRTLAERGASLVVSVDCGIGSIAEAALAKELGLELIVTDHRGGDRPSAAAGYKLSVWRFVRGGRGAQAGLGHLPAGQSGQTRDRAPAKLPGDRRGARRDRHGRGRGAAAG
jgi:single-stranded-DNA-specific exonuclease